MPCDLTWSLRGATKKLWGELSYEDIQNLDNALFGDYRFDDIHYLVIDCMGVDASLLDDEAIDVISHTDHVASTYKTKMKMAFACNLPKLTAQFSKYIANAKGLGNTWDIRLFDDLQSAEAWAKS